MSAHLSHRAMRALEAAIRHGSLAGAAGELRVTPTALSHAIKTLEGQLGLTLLIRSPRGVSATAEGQHLAERLSGAFAEIDLAVAELKTRSGRLTLAVTPAFASLWLAPRLARLAADLPDLDVQIEPSYAPVDLKRAPQIDLAIRYGPAQEGDEVLVEDEFGAFATPALRDKALAGRSVDLLSPSWRMPIGAAPTWADLSQQTGASLKIAQDRVFEDEQYAVQCALAGQGVLLGSPYLLSLLVERNLLVPVGPAARLKGPAYRIAGREEALQSSKVRKFLSWLRPHFQP
ncbi:transcriptional regulator, LysR family protein [Oceanicaulis alexandrii HTCC2633]|uniref:LysR family transcriptional regulator n=1 Tax=Oceanicaulis sp. HTCC2633 TaxID=314254 RepID=UPI0000668B32|nr:LysR substrate-binding domain-containing protein [Oceanicaulis sp. HTCC2633]EAP90455.1 transcriptional regulator, LysR family protein [Oceanicaulis alexandrii HTCC2633] [Oceanicaulis sp. HTCC2633]